jgi:P4 family phage/plasmid primase-like protien
MINNNIVEDETKVALYRKLVNPQLMDVLKDKILQQLVVKKKYKDPFKYVPTHTMVLYTNHLPKVGACDDGTWRRLIVIPFGAKIQGKTDIKNYTDYLVENASPAIMTWVIEGAKKAIDAGFKLKPPKCVQDAINAYREGNDWMSHFIEECCEVGDSFEQKSGELYQEYRAYCFRNGEYTRSTTDFYSVLESTGYARQKKHAGSFVHGLKLKSDFAG